MFTRGLAQANAIMAKTGFIRPGSIGIPSARGASPVPGAPRMKWYATTQAYSHSWFYSHGRSRPLQLRCDIPHSLGSHALLAQAPGDLHRPQSRLQRRYDLLSQLPIGRQLGAFGRISGRENQRFAHSATTSSGVHTGGVPRRRSAHCSIRSLAVTLPPVSSAMRSIYSELGTHAPVTQRVIVIGCTPTCAANSTRSKPSSSSHSLSRMSEGLAVSAKGGQHKQKEVWVWKGI